MPGPVALTLLSKPGCHLCDDARSAIETVREQLSPHIATRLDEVNILDDDELARRYAEDIPVVLVNGRQHAIWRVDAGRLRATIEQAAKPKRFGRARKKETL